LPSSCEREADLLWVRVEHAQGLADHRRPLQRRENPEEDDLDGAAGAALGLAKPFLWRPDRDDDGLCPPFLGHEVAVALRVDDDEIRRRDRGAIDSVERAEDGPRRGSAIGCRVPQEDVVVENDRLAPPETSAEMNIQVTQVRDEDDVGLGLPLGRAPEARPRLGHAEREKRRGRRAPRSADAARGVEGEGNVALDDFVAEFDKPLLEDANAGLLPQPVGAEEEDPHAVG